jgi:hypothetical protein
VDSQATVAIPDHLESIETLQFLELRTETAQLVWDQFNQTKSQFPERADIFYVARDHVLSVQGDAFSENDDWSSIMDRIGLTSNYQARVMDPAYNHMRLAGSAKHWAIEMMTMRMEFLYSIDNFIKAPAQGPNRKVSHMDLAGQLKSGPPYPIPTRVSSKGPDIGSFKTSGPSTETATDDPPENIDGYQMFYKGGDIARLKTIHFQNSRLNMIGILSSPPGDFSARQSGLYLTKQAQVAWEYAQWAKKIVDGNVVPVGILTIAIPKHLLTSIAQVVGDQWRQLVWASRRREPEDVALAYLGEFQWLTGPLCRLSTNRFKKMSDLAEIEIWKLQSGETASQHYTASASMFTQLEAACVGKVWITEMSKAEAKKQET